MNSYARRSVLRLAACSLLVQARGLSGLRALRLPALHKVHAGKKNTIKMKVDIDRYFGHYFWVRFPESSHKIVVLCTFFVSFFFCSVAQK
jgi:hypothetical protein